MLEEFRHDGHAAEEGSDDNFNLGPLAKDDDHSYDLENSVLSIGSMSTVSRLRKHYSTEQLAFFMMLGTYSVIFARLRGKILTR